MVSFPADFGFHPVEAVVDRYTSGDDAAVGFFDPLVITPPLAVVETEIADGEVELILCFFVKVPLVALEGEDVAGDNLWTYELTGGRCIRKTVDYLYLFNPDNSRKTLKPDIHA